MKIELRGLRELDSALGELTKATARNVIRRACKSALEPMRAAAASAAPRDSGDLADSIILSEKRTRRVRKGAGRAVRVNGRWRSSAKTNYTLAMGPSSGRGVLQYASFAEFGTEDTPASAFMRRAWAREKSPTLRRIADNLQTEVQRAAARAARKRRRAAP